MELGLSFWVSRGNEGSLGGIIGAVAGLVRGTQGKDFFPLGGLGVKGRSSAPEVLDMGGVGVSTDFSGLLDPQRACSQQYPMLQLPLLPQTLLVSVNWWIPGCHPPLPQPLRPRLPGAPFSFDYCSGPALAYLLFSLASHPG